MRRDLLDSSDCFSSEAVLSVVYVQAVAVFAEAGTVVLWVTGLMPCCEQFLPVIYPASLSVVLGRCTYVLMMLP
jgi:hypothetical protein